MDTNSKFAKICGHHNLRVTADLPCNEVCIVACTVAMSSRITMIFIMQVDCAYFLEANLESMEDPSAVLKQELSTNFVSDLEQSCPQCFENQRRLVRNP